jgi:hypothetical protein
VLNQPPLPSPRCPSILVAMRSGIVIGLLGFGRRGLRAGNCSRSFSQSSSASLGQAAGHEAATAAAPAATAPKQLSGLPHGRRYLPAAVSAQLGAQALLPGAAASVMGLQRQGCVSITVQCSPDAAGTQILVRVLRLNAACSFAEFKHKH